jgi:hypothetical protein
MGTNAVTDGVPYYSFGDVISRTRADGVKEYWMCIQAPFTKQGETSAVWGTVSQLPKENIWTYTASNGYTYKVPTHLGNNKEYMKDLAEMLYAIGAPEKWEQNLTDGPTNMKAFNLVTKQNVKYINQYYWMRVQRAWESLKLAETIFGVEEMSLLKSALTDDAQGLKLLYHGYSWKTWRTNYLTLYESTITKGEGSEANIRHLTWKEVTKNVIKPNKIEVNCVTQLRNGSQWVNRDFFPEASEDELQPRFCFRFATTKELAGTGAFESMDNIKGIKDVYVYTKEYNVTVGSKQKMQEVAENDIIDDQDNEPNPIRVEEPAVGKVIGADGKFYATKAEADQHGGAVAMVAWLGGDMRCEYDSIYNGLAIAVNVSPEVAWMQDGNPQECEEYDLDMLDSKPAGRTGMAITTSMQIGCEANHVHPVATMAKEQQGIPFMSNKVRKARGFSPWFLGTYAQYVMALESLGASYKTLGTDTGWGFCESWNDAEFMGYFKNAGLDKLYDDLVTRDLWTATMVGEDGQTSNMVWTLQMRNGDKNEWGKYAKFTNSPRALFLMGFKYGNGGTSNTFK